MSRLRHAHFRSHVRIAYRAITRHAHRTTVNGDDVKLCCRRSPSLLEHITAQSTKLRAAREAEAARKKSGKRGGKGAGPPPTAAEEDDDDDG